MDKEIAKLQTRQELLDYLTSKWVVISEATRKTILEWQDAMISDEELAKRKREWTLSRDHEKNPTP